MAAAAGGVNPWMKPHAGKGRMAGGFSAARRGRRLKHQTRPAVMAGASAEATSRTMRIASMICAREIFR
jgi:hypothetical protein